MLNVSVDANSLVELKAKLEKIFALSETIQPEGNYHLSLSVHERVLMTEARPALSEETKALENFNGQEIPPVIKEKKTSKSKKAEAQEVAVEPTPSATPKAFGGSDSQNESAVQPKAPEVSAPVNTFDRAAAIAKAQALVGKLKESGIADTEIMPSIHEVYRQAGCDVSLKIGQFDDASLERFIPLFEAKVNQVVSAQKPSPAAFI